MTARHIVSLTHVLISESVEHGEGQDTNPGLLHLVEAKCLHGRECIARRVFNRWSIKHPERSIPDFQEVFDRHLGQCGILLTIANVDPTDDLNLSQEQ